MAAWLDIGSSEKQETPPQPKHRGRSTAPASQMAATSPDVPKIRLVFMGTPQLAATLLDGLIENKYNIVGVVTKPDSPTGRAQTPTASPVKETAKKHALPIEQPTILDEETLRKIAEWKPDLIVVAAYGKILPKALLDIPGFGCINLHASLLPKWRGASPVQNALLQGETETGVTVMLMDEGMDTGDILTQQTVAIDPDDTKESLLIRLTQEGKELLLKTIPLWVEHRVESKITGTPQDQSQATLCQLIEREDGHIMWTDAALSIYNRYRALFPWPGIFTFWKKESEFFRLKLHRISYQKQTPQAAYPIGQVFELGEKIGVQTGEGVVFLESIQLEGKSQMDIADFLRGNPDIIGQMLQ